MNASVASSRDAQARDARLPLANGTEALQTAASQPSDAAPASWLFPFSIAGSCPCLPSSWTKVQDWLHLTLIIGVLASISCVVKMIAELAWGEPCGEDWCMGRIVSGVVVLPSTAYFMRTIGQYDEQLREKKARHREEVENLIDSINSQVAEMNELCRKVTENANEFAVGRFNDKCEHFQRYLKGVAAHYSALYSDEEMLQELRTFVAHWLRVFAGSLLNPEASPLLRGAEEELARSKTSQEVCNVAIRRLKDSRVAFQFNMQGELPLIANRPSVQGSTTSSSVVGQSFAGQSFVDEAGASSRTLCLSSEGRCGISWLRVGQCGRFGGRWSPTPDGMPLTLHLGCGSLRVLSRVHANLLLAFLVDVALLAYEMLSDRWASFILVIANEVCVASLLACFEQINEIAQLERQIHVFEQRSEEVGRRREEAKSNWEKVQQLHDLWLYRTLPCLAIMGKIHNHLADEDMALVSGEAARTPDERSGFLRLANESLEVLEMKLGPLEHWRGKERLEDSWKQSIGKQLKDCEACADLNQLISRLPIITQDLGALDAPPPSFSEDLVRKSAPASSSTASQQASFASSPNDSPEATPREEREPSGSAGRPRFWGRKSDAA